MFQKIAKHCANDASHDVHRTPLRSSGEAGEHQGGRMGLYQLLPNGGKGARQGPVYRQRHDGDNRQMYLYRWDMDCKQHSACYKHYWSQIKIRECCEHDERSCLFSVMLTLNSLSLSEQPEPEPELTMGSTG